MRVLIADDHAMVRSGLRSILKEVYSEALFDEAGDSQETLQKALDGEWSLIILDLSMPGRGGLDVLKDIRAQCPSTPVLVLSMYTERQFAIRAFRGGAAGYLTKASAGGELLNAVKRLLGGGRYVSGTLAELLVSELGGDGGMSLHERLSDREFEILRRIASGKTVTEIADELFLSSNTVSTYRARILGKMSMRTNAELTHYAISNHLVE